MNKIWLIIQTILDGLRWWFYKESPEAKAASKEAEAQKIQAEIDKLEREYEDAEKLFNLAIINGDNDDYTKYRWLYEELADKIADAAKQYERLTGKHCNLT